MRSRNLLSLNNIMVQVIENHIQKIYLFTILQVNTHDKIYMQGITASLAQIKTAAMRPE